MVNFIHKLLEYINILIFLQKNNENSIPDILPT